MNIDDCNESGCERDGVLEEEADVGEHGLEKREEGQEEQPCG